MHRELVAFEKSPTEKQRITERWNGNAEAEVSMTWHSRSSEEE